MAINGHGKRIKLTLNLKELSVAGLLRWSNSNNTVSNTIEKLPKVLISTSVGPHAAAAAPRGDVRVAHSVPAFHTLLRV